MPPRNFVRQSFSLPPPMLEQLRREAEEKDLTMSQVLRQYLRFGGLGQHQDGVDLKREEGSDDNGS